MTEHEPASQHHRDLLDREVHEMLDALDRARTLARTQLGLSPLECQVVRALCTQPRTISELTRHLAANRSSISMAAQRLEQRGSITRAIDGRRTVLVLADEVQRQYGELGHDPIRRGIERWLAGHGDVRDDRVQHAVELLHMLTEVFDETRAARRARDVADDLHAALRRGDFDRSAAIATSLVRDSRTIEAYAAITEALHRVGAEWAAGDITVVDERLASSTAERVVDRLSTLVRPSQSAPARGRRALVCNGIGEAHGVPIRMIAAELEREGWQVDLVLGDVPVQDLVRQCRAATPDAAFVGVTMGEHVPFTVPLVRAIAAETTVYVGGQAFDDERSLDAAIDGGATQRLHLQDLATLAA